LYQGGFWPIIRSSPGTGTESKGVNLCSATDGLNGTVFGNWRVGSLNLICPRLGRFTEFFDPEFLGKPEEGQPTLFLPAAASKAARNATVRIPGYSIPEDQDTGSSSELSHCSNSLTGKCVVQIPVFCVSPSLFGWGTNQPIIQVIYDVNSLPMERNENI